MKDVTLGTKDKVARRVTISFDQQASLQAQIARSFSPNIQSFQGEFQIVDFVHAYIDYKPKGTYKPIDFLDILSQKFSPKDVQGKVILIGSDAESDADNYVFTPFSRDFTAMSRLEAEANAIDTLILNRSIIRPPKWVNQTLTVLAAFFTLYVVMSFNPAMGILSLILSLLVFSIMTYITLWTSQIWITMIHPILSVFVCYYFVIPYRLIVENRRSWEYFQKHKLLKQVEELKTNFLSMMSHDIKTPIARIQGMSEVILKEKELLSFNQKDSLKTIQESAEELSGFINTVLDLGRIENQKVQLKLTSKDINSLLKEVIQKHDFLARKKEIQIITEFEPLFSSQIDTELMRQVFANLIENAIKYSPPASKVLISTEEIDGKISIQVADQGKGIPPDEIENVFMKFYRSKNAKASSIKGSGLGLYLANYFVELHGGSISVESSVDQGSTFFVELPS